MQHCDSANTPYEILGHDTFGVKECCGRQVPWLKQKDRLDTGVPAGTKIALGRGDAPPVIVCSLMETL